MLWHEYLLLKKWPLSDSKNWRSMRKGSKSMVHGYLMNLAAWVPESYRELSFNSFWGEYNPTIGDGFTALQVMAVVHHQIKRDTWFLPAQLVDCETDVGDWHDIKLPIKYHDDIIKCKIMTQYNEALFIFVKHSVLTVLNHDEPPSTTVKQHC